MRDGDMTAAQLERWWYDCCTAAQLLLCSTALVLRQDSGVLLAGLAGAERVKTASFWDTINVINVKLCIMVLLTEPNLFIPLSGIWLYLNVTAVSNSFKRELCFVILRSWNCVWLLITLTISWIYQYFFYFCMYSGERLLTCFVVGQILLIIFMCCFSKVFQIWHDYRLA